MIEQPLNDATFIQLAMRHYDNPQCVSVAEFEEDLQRFKYLKKLFHRYKENNDLKERLILNHLLVLYNLFGLITTDFLFHKTDPKHWDVLATFLVFLDRMPDSIPDQGVFLSNLTIDQFVLERLRAI